MMKNTHPPALSEATKAMPITNHTMPSARDLFLFFSFMIFYDLTN
jgi:hypothetical protein